MNIVVTNPNRKKWLKCHITKKHKIETLREAYVDTSIHLSSCGERSDSFSDSESESDVKLSNCFENITNDIERFYRLEAYEKCDQCDYKNADLAELVVHIAYCCDKCN